MINKHGNIVIHHSATFKSQTPDNAERSFNENHKNRNFGTAAQPASAIVSRAGWFIQYHWVVYGDGTKRRYREDDEVGYHASNLAINQDGIGICLSLNGDVELPSDAQIATLKALLGDITKQYAIPPFKTHPHRKFNPSKSCPGVLLTNEWISGLLTLSGPVDAPFSHTFVRDILKGETSDEVKALQTGLIKDGHAVDPLEVAQRTYGNSTAKAVLAYQQKHKVASTWELLIVNGARVGPKTRVTLNKQF